MAMKRRITIKDISRVTDVSLATVSLVLNGKPGVSAETRYRILRVARELNYTPNLVARSLVQQRQHRSVALMITNTRNPIFPEIAAGVEEVLRARGYALTLASTYDDLDLEVKEIESITARGVDGIITSSALAGAPHLKKLLDAGFPLVSVLRRFEADALDYVVVDGVKGSYLAVDHLARLGHRRIGILSGPLNTSTGVERLDGALKALADHGVQLPRQLRYAGDFSRQSGYLAALRFFALPARQRPTALFAANDDMAIGAFEAIVDRGLRVPEDVAVVGFNNAAATAWNSFQITTVEQHADEMGRLAARRLIQVIEKEPGHDRPCRIVLEPKLVIRRSCGWSTGKQQPQQPNAGAGENRTLAPTRSAECSTERSSTSRRKSTTACRSTPGT
jgi:LacI family transcriptional regulator